MNLYGHKEIYENLVYFNCDRIKQITNNDFFNSININTLLGEEINFEEDEDLDFVPTDEAKIRVAYILLAAKSHIFLLITGPTSSAKTFSVFVAYKLFYQRQIREGNDIRERPLRMNLSEETSRDDLIGSIVYDEKKCQFVFKSGPFTEAYEKGYWLLIDELSLAPPSVLQAIEAALDSKHLTVQKIGKTEEIEMHKNFNLICTTNPNNEYYQRYVLPANFLDRFLCIEFDNLSNDEMKQILRRKCQGTANEDDVQRIIDAHYFHTNDTSLKCRNMYTLRELDKARFLFKQNFSTNQIIDILYHTRSGENLTTYESPNEDPFSDVNGFISTNNRKKYGKLALDCLSSGFNIILENEKSEGTSYLAEVIAKKFNKDSNPLIINMTDELHVSDITEFSVPHLSKVDIEIKRVKGIIYKAMINGLVVIINDIERGKTRVIESLNDVYESNLLDEKSIKIDRGFEINPKFRIIFTFHSNVPHKLSAAFFNRFIHIKMVPTGEISNFFKTKKGHPINKFSKNLPTIPDLSGDVQYLCNEKKIAPTSQIETYYALTKQSIENGIPVCISSEIGYGINLGMNLFLEKKYDSSKIHTIYCTSETSVEQLIGKYIFEGELLFQKGELLQAAIDGDIIIFHGIEKLTYHVYSCLEAIFDCFIDETRELIIPGVCVSEYRISKNFRCLATYNASHSENKDNKYHISKYFHILPKKSRSSNDNKKDYRKRFPIPTQEDYLKISLLNDYIYSNYSGVIKNLITCFTSCYSKRNIFDTTFRMFIRMIKSIPDFIISKSPIEEAICLFAFYQNINDNTLNGLLTCLNETLSFDYTRVEELIKKNVTKQKRELVKGPLRIVFDENIFADSNNNMSTEQLNSTFCLVGIKSPKILVGSTSFRETLIKNYKYQERVRVFNATSDSTINEIIGGTSFKKNHSQSGRFGHGEIFDLLIEYLQTNPFMNAQINNHDLYSNEIFDVIWSLIDKMDDKYLKPYYKYLFDIIKKESQYATFYELGFFVRGLLLGNTILLKNVDELKESIIDSLIPFLNDSINLKQCFPGDFNYLNDIQIKNPSIFFTCSEAKFNRLSASFRSRVQAIHIKNLTKDDLKQCVDDKILLETYDIKIKDYSDIMRAINVIKIAGVLNKFDTPEERIEIAHKIISKEKNIFDNNKMIFELHELIKYNKETYELTSLRTGATIKINGFNDEKIKELIYVPSLAFLLDLTIISLATHIPLIIESLPGQAKSTFIRDFGYAINKEVVSTNMSKNKPIDEFIGQIKPNEDGFSYEIGSLYEHLIRDEIYLIDEFNLANPSILSLFLNVFKVPYDTEVVHPHEKGPFKKKFDIIATMNPAILTADRMSLPPRFSSCSLIYEMEDYTNSDIIIIIAKIFNKLQYASIFNDYEETIKFIGECHALGMNQSNDVTIRDILKLKEIFQSGQINNDDETPKGKKKKIASYVDLVYSSKMTNCMDQFDDIFRKYLGNENLEVIADNVIKEQYKLKKQMKIALETNRGLIITGPSGSGKTSCIIDMANGEFDNQKHTLHTIQLCAESDISELLGRYEPLYSEKNALLDIFIKELKSSFLNKELVSKDRTALDEYLKDLYNPEKVDETIEKIQSNSSLMANSKLAKKIDHFSKKWKQTISFDYIESLLVKAMRKGEWVVLDNINLCQGDILESLNSLLEENHILRLPNNEIYALDPDPNNPEIFKINPNFRIIMTSDDQNKNESHIIPSPFLSRCIVLKIKKPGNQDLALIGKDEFNIPYYTDFMSKCFSDDSKSHVRDIIRMAKVCKFLHKNAGLEIEDEIGKTIKFVLYNNKYYNIPEKYKNSKKDGDNIYRFIITIFQTNLIDYNIDDESFKPFDLPELIKTIQNLRESHSLNKLFKETLRLACFVLSTRPCINHGENYTIQEKIISLLLCAYLLTSGSNNVQIPNFFWEIKFTPAIWDLIFVAREKYDELTNLYSFKQFMELHAESEEFICESYNYFKKDMKELLSDKMEEYLNIQINGMFNRTSIERKDDPLLNPNKSEIELEKIPISFPSIPNNRLILNNSISYYMAIELLDFFNITPSINLLTIFNINLEEKSIFKEYKPFFLDTMDLDHAQIYNCLLTEYDLIFQIFKEIYNIPDNTENLLTSINIISKKYNVNTGDLSSMNLKFKHFCEKEQNKCNITTVILDVLLKVENMIQYAFEQKRMNCNIHDKQNENRIKALNILQKTQNIYIKEQIKSLMETFINENKINEIIKLGMIDKYITMNESQISESKFLNLKYICPYKYSLSNCREIELSVIITKFIIAAHCNEFQISNNIYQILYKRMSTTDIQTILSDIELNNLNKEKINYHFLEDLLKKMKFQPITMQNINNKEVISNIIKNMNQYSIFKCIALDSSRPKEYIVKMQKKESFYGINEEFTSHLSEEIQEQISNEQTKMVKDIRNLHLEIIPLSLLKEKCKSIPEEDYGNIVSLKCDEKIEGNPIAKLAHFLTDQEMQKLQFEKQDIIPIVIDGQGYKIIPIESLIVNLIYMSKYDIIENSLAKEFNMIDQILEILHPITPQDILKKDIILFLAEINKDDINENEKRIIIENVNELLSSDNLDINNLSLNILYNENYRKKKIQYIIKANEINNAKKAIDELSTIINNTVKQIEENFKFIICERTRKETEELEGPRVYKNIYQLALKILKPIEDSKEKGIKIVKNCEKFIQKASGFNKFTHKINVFEMFDTIFSEESLKPDPSISPDINSTIFQCKRDYYNYKSYANTIKWIDLNQPTVSEIYINEILRCPDHKVKSLCNQILDSIKIIQGMENQEFKDPYLPKIDINPNIDLPKNISDLLIIGYNNNKIELLNEVDYDLGNIIPNSTLKINMFNVTNAKIRTEPASEIQQMKDGVISSIKMAKGNEMMKMNIINDIDNSLIGQLNFRYNFNKPKMYLLFSKPVTIRANSISVKGEINNKLTISIFSDTSLMYNILKVDDIDSEFTENQIEIDDENYDKISFKFKKHGKFKAQVFINFPLINLTLPLIIDINVIRKQATFIYKFNNSNILEECMPRVEMSAPSFVAIISPQLFQYSEDIEIESQINNNDYLHLAYVKHNSKIETINGSIDFIFRETYFPIKYQDRIVPQLSKFNFNYPRGVFGFFKYFDNSVTFYQSRNTETIAQLYYEDDKLKYITFRATIFNGNVQANYDQNGLFYDHEDRYNNKLNILIDQIQEKQNIHFDLSSNFIIPWINIILLFDRTKEELHDLMVNQISTNFRLKDKKTYFVIADDEGLNPVKRIPNEILSGKKIKSTSRKITNITAEMFDHLGIINYDNLFEILTNLDSIKLGLLHFRQICDYKKKIALNIFNIYNVFKALGRNGIMLNTLGEIISIGNILFNSDPKLNTVEVLTEKHDTKSEIIVNFKKNKISDFIFDTMDSYYGPEKEDLYNETEIHFKKHKYVPIKIEQFLESKEYNDLFEIFNYQSNKNKRESIKPTEYSMDEKTEDIKYEEVEPSELRVAQIETEVENIEESEYPIRAYRKSISKKCELYSLTSLERNNNNNFLPDGIVLADGEIPNLDKYVFNVIENIIQTNYSMFIPNEHITILIDISQLSGAQNKNELCINMMVFMHLLTAFEIQFSVWMFACRNLCFCVKKHEDVFDKKRQCLIRDAYFLKRKNPDSYILSAIDTVTRLKNDKKSNLFVIFSTFISPQTLRSYDEWKKIALSCTGNKHIICLIEPYQYTCNEVDIKLKETIKNSDFIHIIRYTNICDSIKKLMVKLFSISKSFSKGSRLERINSITTQPHKINYEAEFTDKSYYCYKKLVDIKKISRNIDLKCLDLTAIHGDFENINMSEFKDFGEINHVASLMVPNKPTKFELSSHGFIIDIKGLINSYLSKFSNLNIFRQKTGEKVREYCADILIDCSNIVKMYSIDHCFISIISLILSLKELNIPYINLIIVGKHLVPLLINQDLKFIANDDYIYSKLYCLLFEEASESRLLEEGIRQILAHSIENSIPHILFVITDAIFGQEHETRIKDIISFAELNGTKVIGIGTGPSPYRIDDIFTLSVFAKNPYMLREALYQLTQIAITKNKIIPNSHISNHLPIMQSENNTNERILEQFSNVPFNNDFLIKALNQKSFDSKNFNKDYVHDETYDAGKTNEYAGYRVLVMLFYEGSPDTEDKNITKETFLHGPKDQKPFKFPSPADKLTEKGFTFSIVTTYQNAMNELLSGEYSVAILATCSDGYEGNKKNNSDYLEPFLIAIKKFYDKGGSLMLFGENPPFIFEVNLILERIGANIMFDENEKEEGGKVMYASKSNSDHVKASFFQSADYTFNATINGNKTEDLFSIGGGLKKLIEGKTLAVFKTTDGSKIEDSFLIFSRTSTGQPSCIYKVSKGREGALFIDNGASKLFNEYNEDGAARYISNLTVASIQYSQFHEYFNNDLGKETIQISMTEDEKAPKPTELMKKKPPLLISIIIDATGSMQEYIEQCKSDLEDFVDICMKKIDQLKLYFQVIAYRDFTEGDAMVEPYKITDSLTVTKNNIANIKENGGGDMCENISIGFETALKQIDEFKTIEKNFKNIFILIAGSPNHDKDFYKDDPSDLSSKDNANKPWKNIWLNINKKMKNENINKLICIDVQKDQWEYLFTKYQYKNWEKYGCKYINSIVKSKTLQVDSFDDIFVNDISNEVTLMYTSTFIGSH